MTDGAYHDYTALQHGSCSNQNKCNRLLSTDHPFRDII